MLALGADAESRCHRQQQAYQSQARIGPARDEQSQFAFQRGWLPCLVEKGIANPQAPQATQREQRDLVAQEAAALWGFWIAAIALLQLVATVIGLFFIKRTLDATWKAVEDTGQATRAMLEANEITKEAQRPWIVIEPRLEDFYLDGRLFGFSMFIKFRNIGNTVATGWWRGMNVIFTGEDFLTEASKIVQELSKPTPSTPAILMPQDEDEAHLKNNYAIDQMPWFGDPPRIYMVVIASARYRLPGSERSEKFTDQKFTINSYLVGSAKYDIARRRCLYKSDLGTTFASDLVFTKTIPSRAR